MQFLWSNHLIEKLWEHQWVNRNSFLTWSLRLSCCLLMKSLKLQSEASTINLKSQNEFTWPIQSSHTWLGNPSPAYICKHTWTFYCLLIVKFHLCFTLQMTSSMMSKPCIIYLQTPCAQRQILPLWWQLNWLFWYISVRALEPLQAVNPLSRDLNYFI
jgi:hypothetical protein